MEPVIVGLFVGFFAWIVLRRRQQVHRDRRLASQGIPADGRITRVFERRLPRARRLPVIAYRFETPGGDSFGGQIRATRDEFTAATVGDPIKILYDPARPSLNRPHAYLVRRGFLR